MSNTPTTRGRYQKQATGDNFNSWGTELNAGVVDMVDEAVHGVETITINGDATLTSNNYTSDQARNRVFRLVIGSATAAFTLTLPAAEDWHFVDNTTAYDATIKPAGGTGAVVRAGMAATVYTNGTVVYAPDPTLDKIKAAAATVVLGSQKITSSTAPSAGNDLTNKTYVDGQDAITLSATATSASAAATSATASAASAVASAASAVQSANSASASAASAAAAATFDPSAYLAKSDNLASIANPGTARTNLAAAPIASPTFTGTIAVPGVKATPVAKGNSGTTTQTFDVSAAVVQTVTVTGAHTWAFSGWPSSGTYGEVEIIATNAGAFALTLPTIQWAVGDGTVSTTFSAMGVTLQAAGKNHFLFWSTDGGTTVYGKAW
jgi:hypothetical protein